MYVTLFVNPSVFMNLVSIFNISLFSDTFSRIESLDDILNNEMKRTWNKVVVA
jgi:hypothetical protein